MNNIKYILFIFILGLAIGCKKDLPSLNENPNFNLEANPDLLFKHSLKRGIKGYLTATNLEYNGISRWMMYFASRSGINTTVPYTSPPGGDAYWNEVYIDAMNNAQVIIDSEEEDIVNLKAAALVWKTYCAHTLTDLWGAIPYSQALEGNPELSFAPEYDTQKEVYERMLEDLTLASNSFDSEETGINSEADLLFSGNLDSWIKFSNSLRFRLAMRVSYADEAMAQNVLNDLNIADLFQTNQASAEFKHNSIFNSSLNEAGNIRYFEGAQYINPSKFLVDLLLESNDPRIDFMLEEASLYDTFDFLDQYKGVPNLLPFNSEEWDSYDLDEALGDPLGEWGDVSRLGTFYLNNERPVPLLSYSEVCFLMAEAAERGMWAGNSLDFLKEGIRTQMEHMNFHNYSEHENITESEIQAYLDGITEASLDEIGTQKWLLFTYENVLESFAEYRRTGFPKLVDFYGEQIDNELFPKRIIYPNSEFTLNRDNYLEALESQGPDNLNTALWWAN